LVVDVVVALFNVEAASVLVFKVVVGWSGSASGAAGTLSRHSPGFIKCNQIITRKPNNGRNPAISPVNFTPKGCGYCSFTGCPLVSGLK
jgi:hypothetical protein